MVFACPQRIDDEAAEKREFLEGTTKYSGAGHKEHRA
jgi:hypothetical protein